MPDDVKRTTGDEADAGTDAEEVAGEAPRAEAEPDVPSGAGTDGAEPGEGRAGTADGAEPPGDADDAEDAEVVEEPAEAGEAGEAGDAERQAAAAANGTGPDGIPVLEVQGELLEEGPPEPAAQDNAEELADARAEAARYLDDLRRLKAEFENYRKRMKRDQSAVIASASSALVGRLLPVLDNFDLAISAAEQSQDFEKMLKGVEMVYGELREVLRAEGLNEIEAEGVPFDPQRHEAVVGVSQDGVEAGTVVGVVRAGYELQGRVIRPAMVKVAQ